MSSAITEFAGTEEVFMHVWSVSASGDGIWRGAEQEVELIGSHTADPKHLDPSCFACHQLRSQLQSIARIAVERVAPPASNAADFDIYYDPGCIVCSPSGQRPCVTVSIYIRSRLDRLPAKGSSDIVGRIKHILEELGVREK
jgi:hypothetical protein